MTQQNDDFWTSDVEPLPGTSGAAHTTDDAPLHLHVRAQELVPFPAPEHPDDPWIAPDLKDLLFHQPEDGPEVRTYLLVDATLRKKIAKIFDLDMLEVEARCLFTGKTAEDWKESAPFLVDMTLPEGASDDPSLVPGFQKSFAALHWGQSTGIIVRTTADFDATWKHFRYYPRVQMDSDKRWLLFRFWDPRVAINYFTGIRHWEDRARQFFHMTREGHTLSMIIEAEGGKSATIIDPAAHIAEAPNAPLPVFRLTPDDIMLLEGGVKTRFIHDVAEQAAALFPRQRKAFRTDEDWRAEIVRLTKAAEDAGLSLDRDIRDFISITLDKGQAFWSRADVRAILDKPHLYSRTLQMMAVRNSLERGHLA